MWSRSNICSIFDGGNIRAVDYDPRVMVSMSGQIALSDPPPITKGAELLSVELLTAHNFAEILNGRTTSPDWSNK